MVLKVDVRTRVFDSGDQAWRVFPGPSYRYYDEMRSDGRVFLNFLGLPVPPEGGYEQNEFTLETIVKSVDYVNALYGKGDLAAEIKEIEAYDYSKSRWSRNRLQSLAMLNSLYSEAKKGDLVVIPSPSWTRIDDTDEWSEKPTLIGEITGDTRVASRGTIDGRQLPHILVRPVRWLAEVDERDLARTTKRSLRTQNALVRVPTDELKSVLGAAYKNVILGDEHLARFVTSNADFKAYESFHFQSFVMASAAAYLKATGAGDFVKKASIYAVAADTPRDSDAVPEQETSIHSPGYTTLKAKRSIPLVIAALFALALSGDTSFFQPDGTVILDVVNTESVAYDPCSPEIGLDEEIRRTLQMMGLNRWREMCQAARMANEHEGFQPVARVSN